VQERGVVVAPVSATAAAVATAGPARRSLFARVAAVAGGVVLADQVAKSIAVSQLADGPVHLIWTLKLNLALNSGLAFSQGRGLTPLITLVASVLVVALVVFSRRVTQPALAIAVGLVLGGAAGNLADRLLRGNGGAVIDFIDFGWWPVFNVADMALSCGAVLIAVLSLRESPTPEEAPR